MVRVAQLVEPPVVVRAVAGSSPVSHPLHHAKSRAERAVRVQCRDVRGLGRVPRGVQLPLLELPCHDRLGVSPLGRDRAREAARHEGGGILDAGRRPGGDHEMRCRECSSLLYWTPRDGTHVRVPYGTLVDEPALKPTAHMFVGSKAPWFQILDDPPSTSRTPGPRADRRLRSAPRRAPGARDG